MALRSAKVDEFVPQTQLVNLRIVRQRACARRHLVTRCQEFDHLDPEEEFDHRKECDVKRHARKEGVFWTVQPSLSMPDWSDRLSMEPSSSSMSGGALVVRSLGCVAVPTHRARERERGGGGERAKENEREGERARERYVAIPTHRARERERGTLQLPSTAARDPISECFRPHPPSDSVP